MNEFVAIINNLGFPIVACIVMYQQLQKMNVIITDLTSTLKTIDSRLDHLENKKEQGVA